MIGQSKSSLTSLIRNDASFGIYFEDDLHNRLTALEAAARLYQGEFREGVLFGLSLVRLSLGLAETLIVSSCGRAIGGETGTLE